MAMDFNKWAAEGEKFLKDLTEELGHPDRRDQTAIVLRSVLHTLRDRLTVSENIDFIAQLPMFLKAVYVEGWSYREKPEKLKNLEEFGDYVEKEQQQYGESRFDWELSTGEISRRVIHLLRDRYLTKGEIEDVISQLPEDLQRLFIF